MWTNIGDLSDQVLPYQQIANSYADVEFTYSDPVESAQMMDKSELDVRLLYNYSYVS